MDLKKILLGSSLAAVTCACSPLAIAGVYADEVRKCFAESSTAEDRRAYMRFFIATVGLNPDVEPLVRISAAQREDFKKTVAAGVEKLLTVCRPAVQLAIRYEGTQAIHTAFEFIGQAAMKELLANPRVAEEVAGIQGYVDKEKLHFSE